MLRSTLALALFSAGILGVGGCHLYFEDDGEVDVREPEMWPDDCAAIGCDEPDDEVPGGERPDDELPPRTCETNEECEAGCYCNNEGFCEESSLCRLNQDCADDFYCSELGSCVPAEDVEPPATCDDLSSDETACLASESCSPVYRGVNCTSESGEPCTSETANCTCESFTFDSCVDAA